MIVRDSVYLEEKQTAKEKIHKYMQLSNEQISEVPWKFSSVPAPSRVSGNAVAARPMEQAGAVLLQSFAQKERKEAQGSAGLQWCG